MANKQGDADSPAAIRARIVRTRASLKRKLRTIKDSLLGTPSRAHEGGKKTMKKKTNSKGSAAKRSTSSKKGGASRTAKAVGKKAKKVIGKVITRAAQGAMSGAVEGVADALSPGKEKTDRGRKEKDEE